MIVSDQILAYASRKKSEVENRLTALASAFDGGYGGQDGRPPIPASR